MKTKISEIPLFQSLLTFLQMIENPKNIQKKLVSLTDDCKARRIFNFLTDYPYMVITLGHKKTLQMT